MTDLTPAAEFRQLSEAEVLVALSDPDPNNRIAQEVARLVAGYTRNFAAHCERLGRIPASILIHKPATAIEAVAARMVTDTIREELAKEG